jgi:endonuclease/exonuclease/phosphatase family metal-dependent hydrolase
MNPFLLKLFFCICNSCLFFNLPGQVPAYPQPENTTRVMSYNIRNAYGLDEKVDYVRIANIIYKVSPDVVALQELDSLTERSGKTDVLSVLGGLTKMYAVYGASIDYQGGKYGIGVLSKEKPLSWKRIPLPGREELRSLLIVEFEKYIVCCTHYSLNEEDRLASSKIVNKEATSFGKPALLAGDINAKPESDEVLELAKSWKMLNNPAQFTIPADKPSETIDYIFGHKADGKTYSVLQRRVLDEPVASDHLPLFVDVRLSVDKI